MTDDNSDLAQSHEKLVQRLMNGELTVEDWEFLDSLDDNVRADFFCRAGF